MDYLWPWHCYQKSNSISHHAKSYISSSIWEEELGFIPLAILIWKEGLFGKYRLSSLREKKTFFVQVICFKEKFLKEIMDSMFLMVVLAWIHKIGFLFISVCLSF